MGLFFQLSSQSYFYLVFWQVSGSISIRFSLKDRTTLTNRNTNCSKKLSFPNIPSSRLFKYFPMLYWLCCYLKRTPLVAVFPFGIVVTLLIILPRLKGMIDSAPKTYIRMTKSKLHAVMHRIKSDSMRRTRSFNSKNKFKFMV